MTDAAGEYRSCAVCGRTILRGESTSAYVTPEGAEATVCELCKPRAEGSDWVPAALAATGAGVGRARRRRGLGLRERIARVSEAVTTRGDGDDRGAANGAPNQSPAMPRPRAPRSQPPGARRREGEGPPSPEGPRRKPTRREVVKLALETFNGAEERRTVAGLRRSLGEPSVSVLADGAGGAKITVAWELSWYQWRVSDDGIEEVAKGTELAELDELHQDWNAESAEDGTLRLRPAPPAAAGEGEG
jgi:hypothetical protein